MEELRSRLEAYEQQAAQDAVERGALRQQLASHEKLASRRKEDEDRLAGEIQENVQRIRSNPVLFQPFPAVPEAVAWLQLFNQDALRYPFLLVQGSSRSCHPPASRAEAGQRGTPSEYPRYRWVPVRMIRSVSRPLDPNSNDLI